MSGSRRLWPTLAAFALVGVLLGGLAAFLVRDRSDAGTAAVPTATSMVAAATGGSPAPFSSPSAGPVATGQATAPLNDAATAAPAGRATTSLAAFGKHVTAAIKKGGASLESLRSAAQAFDIPAVRKDAVALQAWAAAETEWLDTHPPRACYADVHRAYASAIEDFHQAAAITVTFAEGFPFADFDSLQQALDLAESGSASMQAALDLVKGVSC
jgi:hypothetical protein